MVTVLQKNPYFYGCVCRADTAECEDGIGWRHRADPEDTAGEMALSPSTEHRRTPVWTRPNLMT